MDLFHLKTKSPFCSAPTPAQQAAAEDEFQESGRLLGILCEPALESLDAAATLHGHPLGLAVPAELAVVPALDPAPSRTHHRLRPGLVQPPFR